jgi:hypothetical protein
MNNSESNDGVVISKVFIFMKAKTYKSFTTHFIHYREYFHFVNITYLSSDSSTKHCPTAVFPLLQIQIF